MIFGTKNLNFMTLMGSICIEDSFDQHHGLLSNLLAQFCLHTAFPVKLRYA